MILNRFKVPEPSKAHSILGTPKLGVNGGSCATKIRVAEEV